MFCGYCGAQMRDGARFCGKCGRQTAAAPKPKAPAPKASPGPAVPANPKPVPAEEKAPAKSSFRINKTVVISLILFVVLVVGGYFVLTLIKGIYDKNEFKEAYYPKSTVALEIAEVGDWVKFGEYVQNEDDPEPIIWQVVEEDDETLTLISRNIIDFKFFDARECTEFTASDLCYFLNSDFKSTAFSESEQERLWEINGDVKVAIPTLEQAKDLIEEYDTCASYKVIKSVKDTYDLTLRNSRNVCHEWMTSAVDETGSVICIPTTPPDGKFAVTKIPLVRLSGVRPIIKIQK